MKAFEEKQIEVHAPVAIQFTQWILFGLRRNSLCLVLFALFCVGASEWQSQENVLSQGSLLRRILTRACLGGGQELRHSYKRDNPFLSETLQCKHDPPVSRDTFALPPTGQAMLLRTEAE